VSERDGRDGRIDEKGGGKKKKRHETRRSSVNVKRIHLQGGRPERKVIWPKMGGKKHSHPLSTTREGGREGERDREKREKFWRVGVFLLADTFFFFKGRL
jgi:hypothetical protein